MSIYKRILIVLGIIVVLTGGLVIFSFQSADTKPVAAVACDYKNATYTIDGTPVELHDGVAETEAAPGSASKITTRYFGNEAKADLDGDGRTDIAFLITQETGGSGTFYYAVTALNTMNGCKGSEAFFLGDRIAPQTTEASSSADGKNIIIVNYADRAEGEPMTTEPSVNKSARLSFDPQAMSFVKVQ